MQLQDGFRSVYNALLKEYPQDKDLWIEHMRLESVEPQKLSVLVPNTLYRERFYEKYVGVVRRALGVYAGGAWELEVCVENEPGETHAEPLDSLKPKVVGAQRSFSLSLNQKYSFDRLIVGNHNRLACAAALRISECPAFEYNPLFVYGGVGLGKTHLMQAIGLALQGSDKLMDVVYVTSEQFTNDYIYSLQRSKTHSFRLKYRYADLLLVDDVQFFEGKEKIQEELFHTFNMLKESGKQMVFTSDRPPRELKTVTDRLVSRFASGLVAEVKMPDFDARRIILLKKLSEHSLPLSDEIVNFLASHVTQSVRDLEACVLKVKSLIGLLGEDVVLGTVKQQLRELLEPSEVVREPLSIDSIQREVAKYYHLNHADLKSKKRTDSVSKARQIAVYLSKTLTSLSTTQLGLEFGGRNHSTVISSYNKVEGQLHKNSRVRYDVEFLKQRLLQI